MILQRRAGSRTDQRSHRRRCCQGRILLGDIVSLRDTSGLTRFRLLCFLLAGKQIADDFAKIDVEAEASDNDSRNEEHVRILEVIEEEIRDASRQYAVPKDEVPDVEGLG